MKVVIDVDDIDEVLDMMCADRVVGVLQEFTLVWDPDELAMLPVYKVVWP